MCGVALPKNSERLLKSRLFYEAVGGKILAGGVAADEVLLGEEGLSSCVVSVGKVDLGQPEGVVVVA